MSQIASPFSSRSERSEPASVSEETLLEAAQTDTPGQVAMATVATDCPRFTVRSNEKVVTYYEIGQVGDTLAVRHRGEITKTARECSIEPSRVAVKFGFAGRVLMGPRGQAGTVTLPLNVEVMDRDRNVVAARKLQVSVAVDPQDPVGYFSSVGDVNFNFPPGARPADYQVYIAFDRSAPDAG